MVCRENKARSALMGMLKRTMQNAGYSDYKDFEFQSAIHEYGHQFAAADNPSREDYLDWLRGMRQQVINDPSINDAEKYRVSHKQPGVVTRLDQEIARVQSGRDENGRPLRPEQLNGGKHFQSMKHMSAIITRQQEAKQEYHETYARSMGVSVEEARDRWNTLTSRRPEDRENTRISLTDDWRDRLSGAGISRKTQADIGQSNEARYALDVMESERQAHLRALPTRSAFEGENVVKMGYLHPDDPKAKVRCDGCGQFGHLQESCPNKAEVWAVHDAETRLDKAQREYADAITPGIFKQTLSDLSFDRDETIRAARTPDGGYRVPNGEGVVATEDEWVERVTDLASGYDPDRVKRAAEEERAAGKAWREAEAALDAARGPVPVVSSAIHSVQYNPDTGALIVTRPGYTRKSDGVTMPPKEYMYLMGREEFAAFRSSDAPGRFLSETTGRARGKGGNAGWTPQNDTEAAELRHVRQCPTCGQWASMVAQHQCPVPQGRQSEVDAANAERRRQARERARLDSLPASLSDNTKRRLVQSRVSGEIRNGRITFPNPRTMAAAREEGAVGMGGFTAQYFGATVTGRAYTWKDPSTGEALFTARDVKCARCAPGGCVHVDKATDMMANHYRATRVSNVRPGQREFRREAPNSVDSVDWRRVDESYAQIRDRRRDNAERVIAASNMDRTRRLAGGAPRVNGGETTRWPRQWVSGGGLVVAVDDDGTAARAVVERQMQERTGRKWVTVPDGRGGFTLTSPRHRRAQDGTLSYTDRQTMREVFGVRSMGAGGGYHVPADSSHRHETLSRVFGQEPALTGASRAMRMGEAPGPDA